MLEIVVKVIGSFSSYWADLLIAPGIAWNEEDGNAAQLQYQSVAILDAGVMGGSNWKAEQTFVSWSTPCSRYMYNEYLVAKRVCSVSNSVNETYEGRM